ncbi:MAG TPA: PilZ domain-containing protein [Albitalea sp.]
MIPGTNRRLSARKALRRPATVLLPAGLERAVRTWDVGLDGMSVVSAKPIPPGTRCTVRMEIPEGDALRPLDVPVKTIYCSLMGPEGVKVGMLFGALDEVTEAAIQRFMA